MQEHTCACVIVQGHQPTSRELTALNVLEGLVAAKAVSREKDLPSPRLVDRLTDSPTAHQSRS